jgi:putative ATPase
MYNARVGDLFREGEEEAIAAHAPLAVRMRPRRLDEVIGQDAFLGPGKMLRRMLQADRLSSLVFFGPPGSGKTTLAHVIARHCRCEFHMLNGASATVREVREIIERARAALAVSGRRTVLFIDELHRFNRAQQDVLLNDVENGTILLIGATTENPFFTINSPLLSRSTLFAFQPLCEEDIILLLKRALADGEHGLGEYAIEATDEALAHLARISDGDARRALTALEVGVLSQLRSAGQQPERIVFDLEVAQESIQAKAIQYDRTGDLHYDAISAFIKSMRGSDPDATVYWLARMLAAGEDPRFIARRIAILASEDIGNADPRAISVAAAAFDIADRVGMPECRITLAQAAIYMACAPKSNSAITAIDAALDDVRSNRTVPVPRHLRNAPHPGMARLGCGKGYQYSHDYEGGVSPDQDYLGVDKRFYMPTGRGYEKHMAAYLERVRELQGRGDGTARPGEASNTKEG